MKAAKLTLLAVLLVGCFVCLGVRDYLADPLGLHLSGWRRELNMKIYALVYSFKNSVHYGRKAVHITCINNMKQISLSCRLWSGDHGDKFPWNCSTNQGGTMEFCERDQTGFDSNSWRHFQVMAEELRSPVLLVCPDEKPRRKIAHDFTGLMPANVTYRFRTLTNVDEINPREIILVCPFDGNTAYCDGSVVEGKELRNQK